MRYVDPEKVNATRRYAKFNDLTHGSLYYVTDEFCPVQRLIAVGALSGHNIVEGRTNKLNSGPSGSLDAYGELVAHGGYQAFTRK